MAKSVLQGAPKEGALATSNNWKWRSIAAKNPEPTIAPSLAQISDPYAVSISARVEYLYVPKDLAFNEQPYSVSIVAEIRNLNQSAPEQRAMAEIADAYSVSISAQVKSVKVDAPVQKVRALGDTSYSVSISAEVYPALVRAQVPSQSYAKGGTVYNVTITASVT